MRTDQQLLQQLQYVVMEAPDLGATWPSGLWLRTEVLDYLNERQNRFLKSALIQLGSATLSGLLNRQSIVPLPDDWITTVSVVWTGADGTQRELIRSDTFEADHGSIDWTVTAATPLVYMDYATPTLQLMLAPIPDQAGSIDLLYVPTAETLTGDGEVLYQLPDEYAAAAGKYGPLEDMFRKDGRGRSPEKATYCASRFQLGLDAARIILNGRT